MIIKSLPQKGYAAIVIAPNDPSLLVEEIDKLSESGIPILLINVDISTANRLCYVGCDYTQSGVLAAEILAKSINREGEVAVLTLKDPVIAIEQRIIGFRQELSRYKDINIKQVIRFGRKTEGVYEEVVSLLKTNSQIDGIYVSFSALEQTAQAIIDSNLNKQIAVIGYDLSEEIYSYIKKDAITATICHEPFTQGYFGVKILHNYLNRGLIPSSSIMYSKLEAIFSTNAKYYLNEQKHLELFHL
ncbi:MAG TPA: substrate-binding domain-containing protein [Ruminiclostridium sp.]